MNGVKILCVEDNKKVQAFNQFQFAELGFDVATAFTLAEARESLQRESPQLIILDINMPDGDGRDFLKELRASDSVLAKLPVLMLTGYGKDSDVVAGFESGANDYLAKPYSFQVLLMRTKELLRRAEQTSDIVTRGGLTLDRAANRAEWDGTDMLLTPKEFQILLVLTQNEGVTLSVEQIYEKIWKTPIAGEKRAFRKQISNLRVKLEAGSCGYVLNTVYSEGYRFEKA
jgi:DNA-binding response OmpR family regulator